MPGIIYAAHVCTTLFPVYGHLLFADDAYGRRSGLAAAQPLLSIPDPLIPAPSTLGGRLLLMAIYSPYVIIPLHYGWSMLQRERPYTEDDEPRITKLD